MFLKLSFSSFRILSQAYGTSAGTLGNVGLDGYEDEVEYLIMKRNYKLVFSCKL